MTDSPTTIDPSMNAADAAAMMQAEDVGVLPVVRNGELLGMVTDRDLVLRVMASRRDAVEVSVADAATTRLVTVGPDERLSTARDLMREHRIRRLPVVKTDRLVGMLSLGDVAWHDASTREVGETLQAVSESERTRAANPTPTRGTPRIQS